jgi:hypothetical protein
LFFFIKLTFSLQNFHFVFFVQFADEVDIIGYASNQSDIDDYSSAQSIKSGSTDSGVASRLSLTLSEIEMY